MKFTRIASFVLLLSLVALPCLAEVSPEEAAKLKTTLNPWGGERAGNKEGTIPEWTGKITPAATPSIRPGWHTGELFPNEKPLFSITAQNVDKYADKLTEGVKVWLKRHPSTFRLDVYPTHRTSVAPEYVYENTFKNATRAKVIGDGLGVEGAIGGIAFPIPKSGIEVYWNMRTRWAGTGGTNQSRAYIIPPSGNRVMVGERTGSSDYPYYYKGMTEAKFRKDYEGFTAVAFVQMINPPVQAGELILTKEPGDFTKGERIIYTYLVGQRRVRRAPSFAYDSPNPTNSGYGTNDEASIFYGKPDKWNWKLLGKKEMYIPYNCNRMVQVKDDELIQGFHLNPNHVRWELHRVWAVELNLKPGQRHVSPRRIIYFDEDSWYAIAYDLWDHQGRLWKSAFSYTFFKPEVPVLNQAAETHFNMITGGLLVDGYQSPESGLKPIALAGEPLQPRSYYMPDALAARGVR